MQLAYVAWAFSVVVALAALKRIRRILTGDADLTTLKAANALPALAYKDKVVWITGASSGIGESLAYDLAGRGAQLVLSARREGELARVAATCRELGAPSVLVVPLDLLAFETHASITAHVETACGRIDVLVNNGGRSQRALIESTDLAVDRALFELNVLGTISLTKAVLPGMLRRHAGHLVTVSSVAGRMGAPVSGSYSMSKHALQGFFNTLRLEIADRGVAVTMVCPGPVQSQGTQNSFTGTPGIIVGAANIDDSKKMTGARCATLMAGAIHARLAETWISRNPILVFMYVNQYWPALAIRLGRLASEQRVKAFLAGNHDINAGLKLDVAGMLWKGLFVMKD